MVEWYLCFVGSLMASHTGKDDGFNNAQETVVHLGELSCLKQGRRRREAE